MGKTEQAIRKYSNPEDVDCLLWLLHNYNWSSQFRFVASVRFEGDFRMGWRHIWSPTQEGKCLYNHRDELITKE